MANSVVTTVLQEGERNVLVEVTGILDTSDYAVADITTLSSMSPLPSWLRIDKIQYSIEDGLSCQLWWHATTDDLIIPLTGREEICYKDHGGRNNPQSAGATGNIRLSTTGWSGTKHFTIILSLVKQF